MVCSFYYVLLFPLRTITLKGRAIQGRMGMLDVWDQIT